MAIRDIVYRNNIVTISYRIINHNAQKNIVFLHGWGSNKELMVMAFEKSFHDFNHLYIDLPGFGGSINTMLLNTYDYANIIELFLQQIHINAVSEHSIIVGHSFGGKIALLLNREIILLSSAGILLPKPFGIKCKIFLSKILKYSPISLDFLKAQDARNLNSIMYEVFKCVVNEDFKDVYARFQQKATIFWGRNDTATPLESYHTICRLMPHAKSHVLEGDHYFFLQQASLIESLYNKDTISQ